MGLIINGVILRKHKGVQKGEINGRETREVKSDDTSEKDRYLQEGCKLKILDL